MVWSTGVGNQNTFVPCSDGMTRLCIPEGTFNGSDIVGITLTSVPVVLYILGVHLRWYPTVSSSSSSS